MKKVFHFVLKNSNRKMDIFGVSMKLKLFEKDEYCTSYGSLLTVILFLLLCYKTLTFIIEMIIRQEFDFTMLDIPDMDTPLQLNGFTLHICLVNQNDAWSFVSFQSSIQ